jgi:hypothetical protein
LDRFQRPYEAPDGDEELVGDYEDVTFNKTAIQAYLDWLGGSNLQQQLKDDGTSGFRLI